MGKTGDLLRASGMEFGTTTGRPRRCGWLDIVALKYGCQINGFSSLNLTKLDVLTGLKEVKLGTSYCTDDGKTVESFPADLDLLDQIKVLVLFYEFRFHCQNFLHNIQGIRSLMRVMFWVTIPLGVSVGVGQIQSSTWVGG